MKNIVVTGANRGIGLEISKQLIEAGHHVIFTSRTESKGAAALKTIDPDGSHSALYILDIGDQQSILNFTKKIKSDYDHIDVLINNAGIFADGNQMTHNIDMGMLEKTLQTNLYGPILLSKELIPILKKSDDPRIVNVSSGMGAINDLAGGYPAYRISKTSLNAFTINLAAELSDFKINAVCPGWVRTDMGGAGASRSVEQGAETPVWLALDSAVKSGKFHRDKRVIDW